MNSEREIREIHKGSSGEKGLRSSLPGSEIDMKELTILKENQTKFDDSSNRKLMLKFKNFDSYLYGET